jgi:hypothetical protein
MTLAEMKTAVRRKLNAVGITAYFSDDDIADSLQEGLDEMADVSEYYEREATIGLLTGRTYYDLTSLLPNTFLSPRRCWNTTTQHWLRPTDVREQDSQNFVQWELTYGEPEAYLMRGQWWFGVWPRNSNDVGGVRVYFTAIPDALTDTDTPAFPVEFHPGVVDYALCDLLGQEKETAKALEYWKSFEIYAEALAKHSRSRQRIPRMDVL